VEYGKLVEQARAQIELHYRRPMGSRLARDFVYRKLLPYPRRIAAAARLLRVYQRSGLATLARATGVLKLLGLEERERLMPAIDSEFFFDELGKTFPAKGPRRARVAFFAGCVAQVSFSDLNRATIRVLQANGCEVVVPAGQLCCGALASHAGVRDVARDLARANFTALPAEEFDAVITNAAGCGSTLKEYTHLFPVGDASHERAAQFSGKMRDVNEFLAELGLTASMHQLPLRVTYQDSCHLAHGQKIRSAPRKLLASVPGFDLREMQLSDLCCGSAGIYNVVHTDMAMALLEKKMASVNGTGANVIVTANPGCMLQLAAGVKKFGRGQRVAHVVEILDEAYGKS
jgi:glycolate oxidase iron-sulfur subunit